MTRSRIEWFAYAVLIAGLAACGSSKSGDETKTSHAAASGEDSDTDAGPGGSTKTKSSGKTDAGSDTSSKPGDSKSEAGSGGGGKGGSGNKTDDQGKASALPSDGNQLSLCSMAQGDCNKGLACSGSANALAESRDFCSKICEKDDDCKDLTPSAAKYTCSTGRSTKICEIACTGSDDTSCPQNMKCVQTGVSVERAANGGSGGSDQRAEAGGAGGAGGRANPFVPVYHCKYPLITSPVWGPCQDGEHQCDKDATCYGTAAGRAGVCTKNCEMDSDCSEKPSSGSITPSCATLTAARGNTMETKLCVLSCLDKKDGCPDGTTCVDGPRASMGRGRGGMPMGGNRGQGPSMNMGMNMGMGNAGSGSESEPSYARCE